MLSTVLLASWNIREFGSFSTDSSRSEGKKTQTCYFGFATAVIVYCKDCYEVVWLLIVESLLFCRFVRLLRSFFAESASSSFLVLLRFALPLTIIEVTWFCVRSGAKTDGYSPLTSNSYCVSSTARGSNFPSKSAMLFSSHFATRLGWLILLSLSLFLSKLSTDSVLCRETRRGKTILLCLASLSFMLYYHVCCGGSG